MNIKLVLLLEHFCCRIFLVWQKLSNPYNRRILIFNLLVLESFKMLLLHHKNQIFIVEIGMNLFQISNFDSKF